jgi:hypothetical protein
LLPIKTSPDALLDLTRAIDDEIIDSSKSNSTDSFIVPEEEFVELKVGSMYSRIPPQSTGMPATDTPSAEALAGYMWKRVLESIGSASCCFNDCLLVEKCLTSSHITLKFLIR